MSRAKFDKAAGDAIGAAVREIEAGTNAEIVVAVRGRSGTYRHADYLFGAVIALIDINGTGHERKATTRPKQNPTIG